MKSAQRHQLETNELAQRLEVFVARVRPYASTIVGVAVAVVAIFLLWSYISGSSSARKAAAWDAYHRGVATLPPDLEQLRQSAEQYPGTHMQQMADITWADGQVWLAARDYIGNRNAAMEALRRATSAYQRILQTSGNSELKNRAHLGLGRVYEMQNDLERAREEYLKVAGSYEQFAKQQAERLEEPEAQEAYAWLATAEAPRSRPPSGPGTPGERPEFSAGDFPLPGESTDGSIPGDTSGDSFEYMLKGFDLGFPQTDESNGEPNPSTDDETPQSDSVESESSEADPSEPATEDKPAE